MVSRVDCPRGCGLRGEPKLAAPSRLFDAYERRGNIRVVIVVALAASAQLHLRQRFHADLRLPGVVWDGAESAPDRPQVKMRPVATQAGRTVHAAGCIAQRGFSAAPQTRRQIVIRAGAHAPPWFGPHDSREGDTLGDEIVRARIHLAEVFAAHIREPSRPTGARADQQLSLGRLKAVDGIQRWTRDRKRCTASETPAAVDRCFEPAVRVTQRQTCSIEANGTEPAVLHVAAEANRDALTAVFGIAGEELEGGVSTRPVVFAGEVDSRSRSSTCAQPTDSEAPQRDVRGCDERCSMPDGAGTEVQAIRRATRAAHRKAVRRRRPTARSRDGVAHGDTVELNPAVAKRLKAG